ncbi:MAG: glycosyltransferase family 39 protein [Lachnospiraceae bacterium]|nr:glycosyltransferase family 39 protein [Lachnospiraceae bacterium]
MKLEKKKIYYLIFGLILIIAVLSRVLLINKIPGDISPDEAFAGYNAFSILKYGGRDSFGYKFPMYLTAWGSGMNVLESYLSIPFIALFGNHNYSIRIIMVICSILSLVCVYGIVKELSGDIKLSLFSFFICSIMPWHIMMSRWGLESDLAPSFLIFSLYFFVKGLKNEKFFMISSLLYGLTIYAYAVTWPALFIIVLLQIVYAIVCKKIKLTRYAVISIFILIIMSLPAFLFLMVNYGLIGEIHLPFMSIPKLVAFRNNEIGLSNIPGNILNMLEIVNLGDGMSQNTPEGVGLFYYFSVPFIIIGMVPVIKKAVSSIKSKEISLEAIILIQFIGAVVIGILVDVNVTKINIIFMPLSLILSYGIYKICEMIEKKNIIIVPVLLYMFLFVNFERIYFLEYQSNCFKYNYCQDASKALLYVKNQILKNEDYKDCKINITADISYPIVLYYMEENLDKYLETVEYTNYPDEYLQVESFDNILMNVNYNETVEDENVYIVNNEMCNGSVLIDSLKDNNYENYDFGIYGVYYKKRN